MKEKHHGGFERRQYPRVRKMCSAAIIFKEYVLPNGTVITHYRMPAQTRNFSANGALLEVPEFISCELNVTIEIVIPEWQRYVLSCYHGAHARAAKPFRAAGQIIRSEENAPGKFMVVCTFTHLDTCERHALDKYVHDHT